MRRMNVTCLANSRLWVDECRIISVHETQSRARGYGDRAQKPGAEEPA
jgi:hypothetical protein